MLPVKELKVYNLENIIVFDDAPKLISNLKKSGKKVGLCHGGFDLIHPGQVKHFESAKKLCDILFVSITSDKYVTCRKGSGRPIFTDILRAYMVGNIKNVDYVSITNFKKAAEIIEKLKPSFYIKGPDFITKMTPGIISERKKIQEVGGEMRYTNDPKLSTTELINYIKDEIDEKKVLLCIDRDGTLIEERNFLGKEKNWRDQIKLKNNIISSISYLQTKFNTTKIVVSNQAGVARGYFNQKKVEEINEHVNNLLIKRGIKIDNWQYCPDVDLKYAELKRKELFFDKNFVKDITKRKPSDKMVLDSLNEFGKQLSEFSHIIVFGDREDDKGLSKKLEATYIDASEEYNKIVSKLDSYLK
jgi:rfaE bifunctional protein nucleotidyltransferase chain/domain